MAQTFCDPKDIALAALANMVRLMGAELTAGRHRDDVSVLEGAVRHKIASFTVPDCPPDTIASGRDIALDHIEQALADIRAQAAVAQAKDMPAPVKPRRGARPAAIH